MRLVSYNVRYFGHGLRGLAATAASKRAIASALVGLAPRADLIALQEVETRSMRARALNPGMHPRQTQLEGFLHYLDEAFREHGAVGPYRAYYFPAHEYRLGPVKFYTTGLALLVNAQTLDVRTHNGEKPHHITHHGSEALKTLKQTRIAAHLHLEDLKGHAFHVFNTHLSLPAWFSKEFWERSEKMGHGKNQLAEALAVAQFAAHCAKQEPYLVMGDFNSAPATPVYQALTRECGLHGAQESLRVIDPADPAGFPTAGFMNLRMHLDHIFGSKGVEFGDMSGTYRFGDTDGPFHGLSDHVPLVCSFEAG